MSKAITERPGQGPQPEGGQPPAETAPSFVRADEPRFARLAGMAGVMLAVLGGMALGLILANRPSGLIGINLGSICLLAGLVLMVLHAGADRDLQIRRTYMVFGFALLIAGVVLCLVPSEGKVGGLFVAGYPCLLLAWLFLTASVRNEDEEPWRTSVLGVIGLVGAVLALTGFIGGNIGRGAFLEPHGLVLCLLGLAYLCTFVVIRRISDDLAYWTGVAMGVVGGIFFLIALGRSVLPPLLYSWHWLGTRPPPYVLPAGILLMGLGLLYVLFSAGLCSDNRLAVMTRRELAAFFYSPVAYVVFLGWGVLGWWEFAQFVTKITDWRALVEAQQLAGPPVEPIVRYYFLSLFSIIGLVFIVPALTMRLLSEERRMGTLEVLLTAPVSETTVVLSKFFAALLFFLLLWVPWGLYLVALRLLGGETFDSRPLLSFLVCLVCSGAGFVSMGLFFSSITRNQIASAAMTFIGMTALTVVYVAWDIVRGLHRDSAWVPVLYHVSYLNLWADALAGKLAFRFPLFHLSAAVLWLFMTIKVLDARKWS